eukprot:6127941-Pleurochrysis_carterae.AAC.4
MEWLLETYFDAPTEHDCGLHYKITQARYKGRPLKDELIRKMRYLVTIRNKVRVWRAVCVRMRSCARALPRMLTYALMAAGVACVHAKACMRRHILTRGPLSFLLSMRQLLWPSSFFSVLWAFVAMACVPPLCALPREEYAREPRRLGVRVSFQRLRGAALASSSRGLVAHKTQLSMLVHIMKDRALVRTCARRPARKTHTRTPRTSTCTRTRAHTHARRHAGTHARTHARTHSPVCASQLVHERGFNAIPDRKAFKESFAQVEEELHAMVPQSMSTCIVS